MEKFSNAREIFEEAVSKQNSCITFLCSKMQEMPDLILCCLNDFFGSMSNEELDSEIGSTGKTVRTLWYEIQQDFAEHKRNCQLLTDAMFRYRP